MKMREWRQASYIIPLDTSKCPALKNGHRSYGACASAWLTHFKWRAAQSQ